MVKGRRPKPPALRQRRNKSVTAATLQVDAPAAAPTDREEIAAAESAKAPAVRAPNLPRRDTPWHPRVHEWWRDIWRSPMAAEWLQSDRYALELLAILRNDFLLKPSASLAAEIRLQESRFGLTPIDRHRLQWATPKQDARPQPQTAKEMRDEGKDPREALKAVP